MKIDFDILLNIFVDSLSILCGISRNAEKERLYIIIYKKSSTVRANKEKNATVIDEKKNIYIRKLK